MDAIAQRVATRVMGAGDIEIHDVDFASGQEPSSSDDFASLIRVEFTVKGKTLAKLLRKQARVLGRFLEGASKKQVLNAIGNTRDVLKAVTPKVTRLVYDYIRDEFDETPPRVKVDWAEEGGYGFTAKIDPRAESVRVEMEFDVMDA